MTDHCHINMAEKLGVLVFGVLIGATITYLSQEKNRETAKQLAGSLINKSSGKIEEFLDQAGELTEKQRADLIDKLESMG